MTVHGTGPRGTYTSLANGQGRQAPPKEGKRPARASAGKSVRPRPAQAVAHRARARRRRLHRRRLRDRRPARARPAVGQPTVERLRRLRRHERGLVRRRDGRQRHHARGDDAGRQPAGAHAVPRRRRWACCCASTSREFAAKGRRPAVPARAHGQRTSPASSPHVSAMDVALGLAELAALGHLHGLGRRALRARRPVRPRPHRRLPRTGARAVPRRDRPRHLRADRVRRQRLGRRADLHRRARVDGAADGLRAGRACTTASSSTAAWCPRRTSTSPSRPGAKLIVVVNPLVPYVNDFTHDGSAAGLTRRGTSATWASPRSATRPSSCWPTSACTRWPASGSSATPASTSSSSSPSPTTS